jgi:hypothetical protein
MGRIARRWSLVFAAGAFGGLANSLTVWLAGTSGVTGALGISVAPSLTPGWLYPRLVWGGLWGALFLLPLRTGSVWTQGLWLGLGPTLAQLLIVFPGRTPHGLLGLGLGTLTPLLVLAANAVWGIAAASWLRLTGGRS